MKSTGEVMGIDRNLGLAYAKAQMAAQPALPSKGNVFISVADRQKTDASSRSRAASPSSASRSTPPAAPPPRSKAAGIPVKKLFKLNEGRPNALDMIKNGELATDHQHAERQGRPRGRGEDPQHRDGEPHPDHHHPARRASASLEGIRALREHGLNVKPLQEWHRLP